MKILFFTFLTLITISTYSQNYSFIRSELKQLPDQLILKKMVYADSSGYYLHAARDTGARNQAITHLIKVDKQFNIINDWTLPNSKRYNNGMYYIKGNLFWASTQTNQKTRELDYMITPISLQGNLNESFAIDRKVMPYLIGIESGIIISADTTQFLYYNSNTLESLEKDRMLTISVYDYTFNSLIEKDLSLYLKGSKSAVYSLVLNENSTVLMLMQIIRNSRKKESGNNNSQSNGYFIAELHPGLEAPILWEIDTEGKNFTQLVLLRDSRNQVHCTGFYSNDKNSPINGFFDFEISPVGKPMRKFYHEFTKDEIALCKNVGPNENVREENSQKGISRLFKIKNIVRNPDGNTLFVAEESTFYTWTQTVSSFGLSHAEYFSKSILLLGKNGDQELNSIQLIPKMQTNTTSDVSSGYLLFNVNSKQSFLYNESKVNMLSGISDWNANESYSRKGIPAIVQWTDNKNFIRKSIPETATDYSPIFLTRLCQKLSDNDYFVVLQDEERVESSNYYFGRLRVND
jgi:hypothetical protein